MKIEVTDYSDSGIVVARGMAIVEWVLTCHRRRFPRRYRLYRQWPRA